MNVKLGIVVFVIGALSIVAAGSCTKESGSGESGNFTRSISITGADLRQGEPIPERYTCDGENISPALAWTGVPKEAKSLALICEDPDAPMGTWVHWVIYEIPATQAEFEEDIRKAALLPDGIKQGMNDFGDAGYGGPCPPAGDAHRYFFKLYALDQATNLDPGVKKQKLLQAMKGHILAEGELVGKYKRK